MEKFIGVTCQNVRIGDGYMEQIEIALGWILMASLSMEEGRHLFNQVWNSDMANLHRNL